MKSRRQELTLILLKLNKRIKHQLKEGGARNGDKSRKYKSLQGFRGLKIATPGICSPKEKMSEKRLIMISSSRKIFAKRNVVAFSDVRSLNA